MKAYFFDFKTYKAAFNMAADFFLLKLAEKENLIFLRFYSWEKPTVSFGKFQKDCEKICKYFKEKNYDCVKRPSGGRAVLHHNDFTYSFIAPLSFFKKSDLKSVYYEISTPFLETFKYFNFEADVKKGEKSDYFKKFMCFSAISLYEIKKEGKKLLGSAQYRTEKAVLQHGTGYYDYPEEDGKYFINSKKTLAIFDKFKEKVFFDNLRKNFEKKFDISFVNENIEKYTNYIKKYETNFKC